MERLRRAAGGGQGDGKIRGIGIATYIEACAFPGSEPAFVDFNGDGTVTLNIGTQTNGQGHATAYAQFVAGNLDLDFDKIHVGQGDTDRVAKGGGTGGSRSIPLGGVSVSRAGEALADQIKALAADELEASAGDIELSDGTSALSAPTARSILRARARRQRPGRSQRLLANSASRSTYPNGTHICEVEIDPDTGTTTIVRYTIVDDFGVTVNPILLAGQVHGGVVQGIGQALTKTRSMARTGSC